MRDEAIAQAFGFIGEMVVNFAVDAYDKMLLDVESGDLRNTPGGRGSRAHRHLQDLIENLNNQSIFRRMGFSVEAEEFLLPNSQPAQYRRQRSSRGLDVVVKDRDGRRLLAFDLKTGGGWSQNEINRRRKRFGGASLVEIFVNKKR